MAEGNFCGQGIESLTAGAGRVFVRFCGFVLPEASYRRSVPLMTADAPRTGDFASVEDGARLSNKRIAELSRDEGDNDDLAWAKSLVDEGVAALERGDVLTLDEHRARNAARRAALRT